MQVFKGKRVADMGKEGERAREGGERGRERGREREGGEREDLFNIFHTFSYTFVYFDIW